VRVAGRKILIAERKGTWLALALRFLFLMFRAVTLEERRLDDLANNFKMDWEFDGAPTATSHSRRIGLNGTVIYPWDCIRNSSTTPSQHSSIPEYLFRGASQAVAEQWRRSSECALPLESSRAMEVIIPRELQFAPRARRQVVSGALSPRSPFRGEKRWREDQGGYHGMERDMVQRERCWPPEIVSHH